MTTDDNIRDERLQHDINKGTTKQSALSSGKIDRCEYLPSEEVLPSDQRRVIKQAKFTYSPLENSLEKERKNNWRQGKKQIKAIEDHGKQSVESNKRIIKDFIIDKDSTTWRTKKIFNEFIEERLSELKNLNKVINSDNLI